MIQIKKNVKDEAVGECFRPGTGSRWVKDDLVFGATNSKPAQVGGDSNGPEIFFILFYFIPGLVHQ